MCIAGVQIQVKRFRPFFSNVTQKINPLWRGRTEFLGTYEKRSIIRYKLFSTCCIQIGHMVFNQISSQLQYLIDHIYYLHWINLIKVLLKRVYSLVNLGGVFLIYFQIVWYFIEIILIYCHFQTKIICIIIQS